jgi:3-oxoacyl-[acyl-carrier protein] reductase
VFSPLIDVWPALLGCVSLLKVPVMSNQTRTVIVTGASKGIGAQLAKQLASDGFQTIVNYSTSADEANEVVASIEKAGGRAKAIAADVADASAIRALFDRAEAEFGPVDVLVNNAGILKNSPLSEVTDEDYQRQIAINLTGTFNGMRDKRHSTGTSG